MKFILKLLPLVFFGVIIYSCCKDDEEIPSKPIEDRAERYIKDNDLIVQYLQTHFITSEPPSDDYQAYDGEVFVRPIPVPNTNNEVSMWDDPRRRTIFLKNDLRNFAVFPPTLINDPVDYAVHFFSLNTSAPAIEPNDALPADFDYKKHAHVTDSVFVNYKGWKTRDNEVFDKAFMPVWFNLRNVVSGFRQIMPYIKTGEHIIGSNNPIPFTNFGSVLVVIPSGLAYYATPVGGGLQVYDNLVFQINHMRNKRNDWDNDGIPNIFDIADLPISFIPELFQSKTFNVSVNGSQQSVTQNMIYDVWNNNDTDGDGIPNFLDADDDGDDVLTRREIKGTSYIGNIGNCALPKWYNDLGVFQNEWTNIPRTPNDKPNPDKEVHLNNLYRNNADGNGTCAP